MEHVVNAGNPPAVFIGLDGAEPALLRKWMTDGSLPVLASLVAAGVCTDVQTLPGLGDGAVWPTLLSGVNPARHGRYFRRQIEPGSYRRRLYDIDRHFTYAPFWQPVSDAGFRVAALDLPYAPPGSHLNGVQIIDWLIHDRYGRPRGWPDSFVRRVLADHGDDPLEGNSDTFRRSPDRMLDALDLLVERVRTKTTLIQRLMTEDRYDLMATAFTEPHDAGHIFWHLHDATHPQHDPLWRAAHGDPIKRLYQEIDTAIGHILERATPEASVALFAGLGMGPNYTANNALETVVQRLHGRGPGRSVRKWLQAAGAPSLLRRAGGRLDNRLQALSDGRSRFFSVQHNENSGAIRINLQGREPRGKVAPADFDLVCNEIIGAFAELVDAETKRPIVSRVVRVSDHYRGERRGDLPDLLIEWDRSAPFSSIYSPRIGRIDRVRSWGRTGDHTPNAMLLLRSPNGRSMDCRNPARVVDVAPTVAALLGVAMTDIDGVPLL